MRKSEQDTRFWILMSFIMALVIILGVHSSLSHRIDRIDHVAPSGHFACWLEANPAMSDGTEKICGDPVRRNDKFIQWAELPQPEGK